MKYFLTWAAALSLGACATHRDVKDIKMIAFDENLTKGKSSGQFESDDCVFQVLGYRLGGNPDVSRAIANARTMKKTEITDVVADGAGTENSIRYANNVSVSRGGFDAVVFGKDCIVVKGVAYK